MNTNMKTFHHDPVPGRCLLGMEMDIVDGDGRFFGRLGRDPDRRQGSWMSIATADAGTGMGSSRLGVGWREFAMYRGLRLQFACPDLCSKRSSACYPGQMRRSRYCLRCGEHGEAKYARHLFIAGTACCAACMHALKSFKFVLVTPATSCLSCPGRPACIVTACTKTLRFC